MVEICLYGTVYNNADTVEESIKSVFDPSYKIIVTDNYSTDGTYEKLEELRKDFNLTVLRYKSSRGVGRQYSLKYCPENSMTAYFDLDVKYNKIFHDILKYSAERGVKVLTTIQHTLVAPKKEIMEKGGWRDLIVAEDIELWYRVGFDYHIPLITMEKNLHRQSSYGARERRYSKGIKYYYRWFMSVVDTIRGRGFTLEDAFLWYKKKYHAIVFLAYIIAKAKGMYRGTTIPELLEKIYIPDEFRNYEDYILVGVGLREVNYKNREIIRKYTEGFKSFFCDDDMILLVKNEKTIEYYKKNLSKKLVKNCEIFTL
ncbi:glycosyltransferase [Stygiolobus azoricus]|uniref:Glycosyltransferase n=1 Tax=Stygiolobus azoricus TaxID=41675 RepID=A0A650CRH4_9CREN|nr:glycosyltransferase [Stygiolobus azoricus]QGR20429.1 glycosyltransferase [Stygiolobus azoricus]